MVCGSVKHSGELLGSQNERGPNCALCRAVPNITRNGLAGVLQRSLQPAFDDQVCFVATVRLAKPQFIKVLHTHTHTGSENAAC